MLHFSKTLRTKEEKIGQHVHLVGKNNWLRVKIVSGFSLLLFILFMIFLPLAMEKIAIEIIILSGVAMLFLGTISIWNLINKRRPDSLLSYLIFDRSGITLNHKQEKKFERILPSKDIKRIRIIIDNDDDITPSLKLYLNYRRQPFLEFDYANEKRLSTREVLDLFMHSSGLIFFQKYPLTNSTFLYEYTIETELKRKERFSRKNFTREEKEQQVTFRPSSNQKQFVALDLEARILHIRKNLLNTSKIKFSDISTLDTSISFKKNQRNFEDDWILPKINMTNHSNKRINILTAKAPLEGKYNDILEFESLKEMDEIVAEIRAVLGIKSS